MDKMAADGVEVVAKVVLTPHQRSHQFMKREVVVSVESAKIGRSVARTRILPSNLIFDCRVLSRSHAVILFDNGKFFIQDTKSSNGTFVNDRRLSRSGEESPPYELKSGDMVQFGVNVEGPSRVTHGCIIGTVRLYIDDREQMGRDVSPQDGRLPNGDSIDERDIEEALRIVQTAYRSEAELEVKLTKLQEVITAAQTMAGGNMMAIVKEDQLLSRLEMMENQLQLYTQDLSEDDLKGRLSSTLEEKLKSEQTAKDKIHKLLDEKAESVAELAVLKQQLEDAKWEVRRLITTIDGLQREHEEEQTRLSDKIKLLSEQYQALEKSTTADNLAMTATQEELKTALNQTREQLESVKTQLEDTRAQLDKANLEKDDLQRKLLVQSLGQHRDWEAPLKLPAGGPLTEEHIASLICESVILKGQLTLMEEALAERDLQIKLLKGKIGEAEVSFRPKSDQGDENLMQGKGQEGDEDLQRKCRELQKKLSAKEEEMGKHPQVKSLSNENKELKLLNAELHKEVAQLKAQCSELMKPAAGSGGHGSTAHESGTVVAAPGGDDSNSLMSALIWCSVGIAVASVFYYLFNRGG